MLSKEKKDPLGVNHDYKYTHFIIWTFPIFTQSTLHDRLAEWVHDGKYHDGFMWKKYSATSSVLLTSVFFLLSYLHFFNFNLLINLQNDLLI